MGLIFAFLLARGRSDPGLDAAADGLLRNLSLLFVPAAVGIVQQAGLIAAELAGDLRRPRGLHRPDAGRHRLHLPHRGAPHRQGPAMTGTGDLYRIWVYLSQTPLLWLTATLIAFAVGDAISAACHRHPLANPVVIAAGAAHRRPGRDRHRYQTYFEGAQFVHFLLGPATVALGLPLWRNRAGVRRNLLPMLAALTRRLAHRHRLGGRHRLGVRRARARSSPRWRPSRSPRRSPWR